MRYALVSALVVSALGAAAAQNPPQQTDPAVTFRTDARLVRVSVVVHDRRGEPVSGLSAADFELVEDGQARTIALFSVEGSTRALNSPLDSTGVGLSVGFQKTGTPDEFRLSIHVASDSVHQTREGDHWVGALAIAIAQALPTDGCSTASTRRCRCASRWHNATASCARA